MSQPEKYDVVILGSGAFGKLLSWSLASQGKKTAVAKRYVGGSCPNIACLPSKNVVHSAKVANEFARHAEFGMAVERWKVDMAGVRERKRKMVEGLVAMHLQKYKESGAELVMGQGRFVAPRRSRSLSMAAGRERWKVRLRSSTRVRGRGSITFRGFWTRGR